MNINIVQQTVPNNQLGIYSDAPSITSRGIAELIDARHDSVKRAIERLVERDVIGSPPLVSFKNINNVTGQEFLFSGEQGKRDSIVVVAQLSPEFTARLVDRWQELEIAEAKRQLKIPNFSNPAEAARAWAEQYEATVAANEQLAIAAPKAEFVDKYIEGSGLKGFRQVAKLLNIKEPAFRLFLQEEQIMYRLGSEWVPYANHIDAGRFELKTGQANNGRVFNTAKFTPKGVEWIAGEWAKYQLRGNA